METQGAFRFVNRKVVIFIRDRVCETPEELLSSELFNEVVTRFVDDLKRKQSPLLRQKLVAVLDEVAAKVGHHE